MKHLSTLSKDPASPAKRSKSARRLVHGDDLIYRFLEDTLKSEPELFGRLPELFLTATAIWLPPDIYKRWPVLLPWVVRDPSCRGNSRKGTPDVWGAPNADGFLRDDNSLIKGLPRALAVRGPTGSSLGGARMGTEFVAAHVWRETNGPTLASRHPLLNSFVPNVVWLPSQFAKLTDREGSAVQRTLQSLSWSIYRNLDVSDHLRQVVDEAWALLPEPEIHIDPLDANRLNWFVSTESFFALRRKRLGAVRATLQPAEDSTPSAGGLPTRYVAGLRSVSPDARAELLTYLERFGDDRPPG